MQPTGTHNYFTYILTNKGKTVFYTGVTNDLRRRINEHYNDSITNKKTFAGKYNCCYLIYFERYTYVNQAIEREKEIKDLTRQKKEDLISEFNSE